MSAHHTGPSEGAGTVPPHPEDVEGAARRSDGKMVFPSQRNGIK